MLRRCEAKHNNAREVAAGRLCRPALKRQAAISKRKCYKTPGEGNPKGMIPLKLPSPDLSPKAGRQDSGREISDSSIADTKPKT